MPFEPGFMSRRSEFEEELARVATPAGWAAFKARWFHDQPWPRRTEEALRAARGDGAPFQAGGRTFRRAPLPDDLTPEARYAYFTALARGFAATFPPEDQPGAGGSGVRYHCPACEILSDDPGEPGCPLCRRPLLRMRFAPPPR
jgi:hypothetical protein